MMILSGLYLDIQFNTAVRHLRLEVMFFTVACIFVPMSIVDDVWSVTPAYILQLCKLLTLNC